ncbi:SDR family NAD(P)-dependent oxidoreductase [Eubacteriales bacterium mix99]
MSNSTAIITGGNRGVGKGVALVFAEKGYDIFLAHNGEEEKARSVADTIKEKYGVRCVTFDCDLSQVSGVQRLVKTAVETYGKINVLMSNAGVGYERYIRYAKVEEIDHVYRVNYRAGILLAKLVGQHMIENNISGNIVFTASVKSIDPTPIDCIYGGLKAGLKRSAQSLAREFASFGIRVNTVSPGCIAVNPKGYEDRTYSSEGIPVGRTGKGEDIGYAAAFLCSREATFITGTDLLVDGGQACGSVSGDPGEDYDGIHGRGTKIIN